MKTTIFCLILGLLLIFGGVGNMELDDVALDNVFITGLGLFILVLGVPGYDL